MTSVARTHKDPRIGSRGPFWNDSVDRQQLSDRCRLSRRSRRSTVHRSFQCSRAMGSDLWLRRRIGANFRIRTAASRCRFQTANCRCLTDSRSRRGFPGARLRHPSFHSAASVVRCRFAVSYHGRDRSSSHCLILFLVSLVCSPYNCSVGRAAPLART